MSRRAPTARDLVRCTRCRRLVRRTSAKRVEGAWLGPECLAQVARESGTEQGAAVPEVEDGEGA